MNGKTGGRGEGGRVWALATEAGWWGGGRRQGPPLVQCNGQSSCEKRSPLFPTPSAMQRPASAAQGQVTSPTHAEAVGSHNAQLIYSADAHILVRIERDRRRWVVVMVHGGVLRV